MGTTQYYDLPYPECAPPLLKDAADAADFRDLAFGIDGALDQVYAKGSELVFNPDAARMTMSASVAVASQNIVPFYNSRSFDTTLTDEMTDLSTGGITVVEPGRYWCAAWVELSAAVALTGRIRLNFGSTPVTNFQTPAFVAQSTLSYAMCAAVLSVTVAGTILRSSIRHNAAAATVVTYASRISCLQLEAY